MKSSDGKRRRVLSAEERVLWTAITKSIAPLRDSDALEEIETAEHIAPQIDILSAKKARSAEPAGNRPPAPLAALGRRMRTRVARGKEAIDGRLDLHGLTQSEAHRTLLRFLQAAAARGARLVLVITGKGRRGEGERGILKRQVPQWLGLPEFRALIVGFEQAHVAHGGEGALYIRLRRTRRI
ncbi:MAG TPA: Smr/MutS family protein [Pseudolabrys sp.]|jgi:DNA-nicking Smr family endonuclease|nr:Smr/MutS family protein [Pseudolabrys sp.]